jgi:16S rRNA (uracil1498-N3)-methyltransferase
MSAHRFFIVAPLGEGPEQLLPLAPDDAHHAVAVLRVRPGEELDVVEPTGRVMRVEVVSAGAEGVFARLLREVATTAQPQVTLVQGVAKGDKMDDIVRQAVELGAEKIMPVLTARSVVKLDTRKRAERGARWRRVAEAAAKQSKRNAIPVVEDPTTLRGLEVVFAGYDLVAVLWEECDGLGLVDAVSPFAARPNARVAVVVGPEGGLTAEEVTRLVDAGAVAVTLGPSILRTETAAVAAVALALSALGGLGGTRD